MIQVNPTARAHEPTTVLDIADRRNELSGNLSLYQELSFVEKIDELLESGTLSPGGKYRQIVVRIIEMPSDVTRVQGPASKLNRDPAFLGGLIERGRQPGGGVLDRVRLRTRPGWPVTPTASCGAFTDGAEIVADGPFGAAHIRGDAERRDFVTERLCDTHPDQPGTQAGHRRPRRVVGADATRRGRDRGDGRDPGRPRGCVGAPAPVRLTEEVRHWCGASVAEPADAPGLGPGLRKDVGVRVSPLAQGL